MRKKTGTFLTVEQWAEVCEVCGKELDPQSTFRYDFRHTDGYDYYGEVVDCCSMKCLLKLLLESNVEDNNYYFPGGEDTTLNIPAKEMLKLLERG